MARPGDLLSRNDRGTRFTDDPNPCRFDRPAKGQDGPTTSAHGLARSGATGRTTVAPQRPVRSGGALQGPWGSDGDGGDKGWSPPDHLLTSIAAFPGPNP